jgi:hypothetical protein
MRKRSLLVLLAVVAATLGQPKPPPRRSGQGSGQGGKSGKKKSEQVLSAQVPKDPLQLLAGNGTDVGSDTVKYEIKVQTSKRLFAGTDNIVFVNLVGQNLSTGFIELDDPADNFEFGRLDRFVVEKVNVGDLDHIVIEMDKSDSWWQHFGTDWSPQWIEVKYEPKANKLIAYKMYIDKFLTHAKNYTLYPHEESCPDACRHGLEPRSNNKFTNFTGNGCRRTAMNEKWYSQMVKKNSSVFIDQTTDECCNKHDKCYVTCGATHATCESDFYSCLNKKGKVMGKETKPFGCLWFLDSQTDACNCVPDFYWGIRQQV